MRHASDSTSILTRSGFSLRYPLAFVLAAALVVSCGKGNDATLGSGGASSGSSSGMAVFGTSSGGGTGGFPGSSSGASSGGMGIVIPTNQTPLVVDDTGKSGVPAATIAELKTGGTSCTTQVLYPFPLTLFPAEGVPPTIQWSGAADAAYIKMTYGDTKQVLYEAAMGASNPGAFLIPQNGWSGVSTRTPAPPAPRTVLQVTLTVKSGAMMSTCQLRWYVASGALNGTIYYNSYDDPTAASMLGFASGPQGAVMRLRFGATKPDVFLLVTNPAPAMGTGPCTSCHSVSARGSSMAATYHNYGFAGKTYDVYAYDIKTNPNPEPPRIYPNGIPSATFGALTADGQYLLTMGNPQCTAGADTFPRAPNNFPLVEGPVVAKLWSVQTGMPAPSTGLNPDYYMWMPQFSPNGDKVVFNHARPGTDGRTNRRELAIMDYDAATQAFSNLQSLYVDDGPAPSIPYPGYTAMAGSGTIATGAGGCTDNVQPTAETNDTCSDLCYPGWPFFTPDGKKVIFARGTEPDFAGMAPGLGRTGPSLSKLFIIDVATKQVQALVNATNGLGAMNLGFDFFPTVMPVASGGQFWTFFTSRRTYGSTLYPGVTQADSKKIWVSAIDIGAPPNVDPSHPPFYLAGQGASGNLRAFPTLNPCKADGATCGSGLDCCGGSCNVSAKESVCGTAPMGECAQVDNKCTTSTDCCQSTQALECLGGFCAVPAPPR